MLRLILFSLLMFYQSAMATGKPAASIDYYKCMRELEMDALHRHHFSDAVLEDIYNRTSRQLSENSLKLTQKLNIDPASGAVDTLFVGGGLHGSIFSSSAAALYENPSLMVVEATSTVSSVFGPLRGTFRINSREEANRSANYYPSSPLAMRDLTKDMFATSLHMAILATAAQDTSNVPVLFNQKIVRLIDRAGSGAAYRYLAITDTGLAIPANKIVFGTGLGQFRNPFKDRESTEIVESEIQNFDAFEQNLKGVMTGDQFLTIFGNRKRKSHDFQAETKGKMIVVVGPDDGGKIVNEALTSKLFSSDLKIGWVGQKASTGEGYRESTWFRYFDLGNYIGTTISPVPSHANWIKRLPDGRYQVYCGETDSLIVADHVILATGYKENYSPVVQTLITDGKEHAISKVPVLPADPELAKAGAIGVQLAISGLPPQDIYVAGPAAGQLATESALKDSMTGNPVSVEVLGPRTALLARALVKDQSSDLSLNGTAETVSTIQNFEIPQPTDDVMQEDLGEAELLARLEWTKVIRHANLNVSQLTVEFSMDGNRRVAVKAQGLSSDGLSVLLDLIRQDVNFEAQLIRIMAVKSTIRFLTPVLPSHRPDAEHILVELN